MSDDIYYWKAEASEAQLEIARHHRDLTRISQLVDKALTATDISKEKNQYREALKQIRNIVG